MADTNASDIAALTHLVIELGRDNQQLRAERDALAKLYGALREAGTALVLELNATLQLSPMAVKVVYTFAKVLRGLLSVPPAGEGTPHA